MPEMFTKKQLTQKVKTHKRNYGGKNQMDH